MHSGVNAAVIRPSHCIFWTICLVCEGRMYCDPGRVAILGLCRCMDRQNAEMAEIYTVKEKLPSKEGSFLMEKIISAAADRSAGRKPSLRE